MATEYFKEYNCSYTEGNTYALVTVRNLYINLDYYSALPTPADLKALFGVDDLIIALGDCFTNCVNMKASPRLPEYVYDGNSWNGMDNTYKGCTSLIIPPRIPKSKYLLRTFEDCTSLIQAPALPYSNITMNGASLFHNCSSLLAPCSLPPNVTYIPHMFEGCAAMSGEMIVRHTMSSLGRADALKDTVKPITIYGDRDNCEAIAATANNGNASWAPWYDPVPAVTDRGQGSKTTAADMTRMVRNGALAVSSYAPGRMRYQQGDIVREDEWIALVDAAKTIDPTVTYSTVYSNLNKIEAAFDSAL